MHIAKSHISDEPNLANPELEKQYLEHKIQKVEDSFKLYLMFLHFMGVNLFIVHYLKDDIHLPYAQTELK